MSVAATSPETAVAAERSIPYKWRAGLVVIVGAIMVILDQTVVNVALPTLERDFGVSLSDVQWIVTAYALALAAVIPLGGWLSDRYGTKRVFVVSQLLFTGGSILCGLAWSNQVLIGFRILQGLGGALIMPVGMTILMSATRPEERGRMMAVLGAPMMIGPPRRLLLSDEPAEIAGRADVTSRLGHRQQTLGRDPGLGLGDTLHDDVADRVVVVTHNIEPRG